MAFVRFTKRGVSTIRNISLVLLGGFLLVISMIAPRLFGNPQISQQIGADIAYADAPDINNCSCDPYHDGIGCSGDSGGCAAGDGCGGSCY